MSVKVHGMTVSSGSMGSVLLAMDAGCGNLEMCDLMSGAQNKPEFLALNPFHHIPTVQDGEFAIGESNACMRYLAMKYKKQYYPVDKPEVCGRIDFATESFGNEVYEGVKKVIYPILGFMPGPEDKEKAAKEFTEVMDTWAKHFLSTGKFVNGDELSIADFKAVPFLIAATVAKGLDVPERIKTYVEDFCAAVPSSSMLKEAGGYSIVEFMNAKQA